MRWTAIPLSLLAFLLLYLLFSWSDSKPPDDPDLITAQDTSVEDDTGEAPDQGLQAAPETSSENCLTEFQAGMGFLQEISYMDKVSLHGDYADSYFGNSAFELEALASQGDSAAMTVLGVQYFLAAHSLDPLGAPALLNPMAMHEKRHPDHEAHRKLLLPRKQEYDEEQLVLMAEARYWLMESVLHGRYLAMELIGTIDGRVAGNAVGQGWISQEDYDELSRNDQASTHPGHVFRQAGYMLLPEGGDGVLLEIAFAASRLTERGDALAAEIAAKVTSAQEERGLRPEFGDLSGILSSSELMNSLCEDDKARILEERNQQ